MEYQTKETRCCAAVWAAHWLWTTGAILVRSVWQDDVAAVWVCELLNFPIRR